MGSEVKKWVILGVFVMVFMKLQHCVYGEKSKKVVPPCFFILGDSLSDNGNNNNLNTRAKSNFPPYGIDFPTGPTGRFTNGRTVVDILTETMGFDDYIPSFASAKGTEILKGVNYASAGCGIRNETGQNQGERIPLDAQLQNHKKTIENLVTLLGNKSAAMELLSKCIYSVWIGSNDYMNNYFLPEYYPTSRMYNLEQYAGVLIDQFSQQLRQLHNDGARKVALFGLSSIGCTPRELARYNVSSPACVEDITTAIRFFNDKLKPLPKYLNSNLTDAKFTYINVADFSTGILPSSSSVERFLVKDASCCKVASGDETCIPSKEPCIDRFRHMFWDAVHPTELTNLVVARRAYRARKPTDGDPYDFNHLVLL